MENMYKKFRKGVKMKVQIMMIPILILLGSIICISQDLKYKISDFNNDDVIDTVYVSLLSGNYMPSKIVWGENEEDCQKHKELITYFNYPDFKSGSFTISDFNHDNLLDIYVYYIKLPKNKNEKDTIAERLLFGQPELDKQNKIEFHKIKDIQLNPFLALEITEQRNKYDKKMRKSYGGISYLLKGLDIKVKEKKGKIREQSIISNNIVNIYPNPASQFLYIDLIDPNMNNYTVKILNVAGNNVYNDIFLFSDKASMSIDVSALASGVYFLILESDELFYNSYKFQIIK